MNKKILFLNLIGILLLSPFIILAQNIGPAEEMVGSVKGALLTIGGTMVVIGWIIAGILWLISAGSPEKTGTAKKATVAAVIGTALIVVAELAYNVIDNLLNP